MATLINDPDLEQRIREEREVSGSDRFDEVWDGVYVMAPMPNNEHQDVAAKMLTAFVIALDWTGLGHVLGGVNVSDREVDWTHNYRIPDVAVFLHGGTAKNCGTHWWGGPDFAVEIISPKDGARDKLPFYEQVGVRELLLIDRDPWRLEMFRLIDGELKPVGAVDVARGGSLTSQVLPLRFQLVASEIRPQIEVLHVDGIQHWRI